MKESLLKTAPAKSVDIKTATLIAFYKAKKQQGFIEEKEIVEAMAITLAYDCALPAERVVSIQEYFKSLNGDAMKAAMDLNEAVVVDFRLLMARILHYYTLRYETAYVMNAFITNVVAHNYSVIGKEAAVMRLAGELRTDYFGK